MAPVADRVAKQNALFEEYYQSFLKNFPERATAYGDYKALAYKMGQLTILRLRDEAKTRLGKKFDLKAFHDEILNGGAMPLDLLQERVEAWINVQGTKAL